LNDRSNNDNDTILAEQFFCWQHKDQAADAVILKNTKEQQKRRLLGKTSLDTLVDVIVGPAAAVNKPSSGSSGYHGGGGGGAGRGRASVLLTGKSSIDSLRPVVVRRESVEIASPVGDRRTRYKPDRTGGGGGDGSGRNQNTHNKASSRLNSDLQRQEPSTSTTKPVKVLKYTRPSLFSQLFCCVKPEKYHVTPPVTSAGARRGDDLRNARYKVPTTDQPHHNLAAEREDCHSQRRLNNGKILTSKQAQHKSSTTLPPRKATSQSGTLSSESLAEKEASQYKKECRQTSNKISNASLKYNTTKLPSLPVNLSRETRNRLRTEVAKPISHKDQDGYIYIFWLSDKDKAHPNNIFKEGAVSKDGTTSASNNKLSSSEPASEKRTLLKIGRAVCILLTPLWSFYLALIQKSNSY